MSKKNEEKIKLPLNQFWLNTKSFFLSSYYEIWLSRNNFNQIKSLHNLTEEDLENEYSDEQKLKIRQIAAAIKRVKEKAPWKPKCYNLALLARKLLKEYDIPNILKIGFRKRNNIMEGHAWVRCNKVVVSGYLPDLRTYKTLKPIKN